ncbi:MAG: exo-alpha-sialidase [Lentisphaeria bacterium]|nr:exo-alpha-sialidase [Lentisphaeria bacterium]
MHMQAPIRVVTEGVVKKTVLLPPGADNPRNSEGAFVCLRDGRVLFVYSHFTGGRGDHAAAFLAGRFSADGGETWSREDVVIVPNEGTWNVMSVSLLRLPDGRIALFYLCKNSLEDCRPVMRVSSDEGASWSEAVDVIGEADKGYYVLNNDRVIQLDSGRLVAPVALHNRPGWSGPDWAGEVTCYLSDDLGASWRCCATRQRGFGPDGRRVTVQEPGVVQRGNGDLLMFVRTDAGVQYTSQSGDGGETWPPLAPSTIRSPLSPASIKRIPSTGELLLVWNDHSDVPDSLRGRRTPLAVAVSRDEGWNWVGRRIIEDDPEGWYCYTAIGFCGEHVLLAYCSGKRAQALATTTITRFPVRWLTEETP